MEETKNYNEEEQHEETELEEETIVEPTNEDEEIDIEALQTDYEKVVEERDQLKDRMLRIQAEYENFKRRTEKERIAERKYQSEKLATLLLPVLDNFERALNIEVPEENKGFMDGMNMIYEQLEAALKEEEIEAIEAVNEPFDPNIHQAVMQVEDENFASNVVVEELQKGYKLKDKVIRPAMVKVNK